MTDNTKISVIIASKNGGRFLRQTLDSIVQQSFTNYEIVVADSESTDDTLDILNEYKTMGIISDGSLSRTGIQMMGFTMR